MPGGFSLQNRQVKCTCAQCGVIFTMDPSKWLHSSVQEKTMCKPCITKKMKAKGKRGW